MTDRICQNPSCGNPLTSRYAKRFCSHPCATAGARTRPLRSVDCPCGVTFTTTDPTQRYHTDACRRQFNAWKTSAFRFMPRQVDKVWRY